MVRELEKIIPGFDTQGIINVIMGGGGGGEDHRMFFFHTQACRNVHSIYYAAVKPITALRVAPPSVK